MQKITLSNIRNDIKGYNELIRLYEEHKEDIFENIELDLTSWFDANLSAVLGAILDKIGQNGLNNFQIGFIQSDIQKYFKKTISYHSLDFINYMILIIQP